ncbi:hypothetical protein TNCV_2244101 [Trichonephila clavipes]|nr:hypothetical protein TNCV_2244101 [Trichonephila clavipes]
MRKLFSVTPDNPIRNVAEAKSFNHGSNYQAYGSVTRKANQRHRFPSRCYGQHNVASHVAQMLQQEINIKVKDNNLDNDLDQIPDSPEADLKILFDPAMVVEDLVPKQTHEQ